MPELPEVQTTVSGLQGVLPGLTIKEVWSDSPKQIKSHAFSNFRKEIIGKKILGARRRAKNILIDLSGEKTLLIHMKMTGHILYGRYEKTYNRQPTTSRKKETWVPAREEKNEALRDPFNRFVHLVLTLSNDKHMAFSDTRKFGKIVLDDTKKLEDSLHLVHLGPEPLLKNFTLQIFKERIARRPNGKIKTVLMDQTLIAGIGNIYSDEILWRACVHPERLVKSLSPKELMSIFKFIKPTLLKGIGLGGDSMSDYRNIFGERGKFQETHYAYRKTGEKCGRPSCLGLIERKVVNGRSAHFCIKHQK